MQIQYSEKLGFYFATDRTSSKVRQIISNPNVALLFEQQKENIQTVIDGLAFEIIEDKQLTWNEEFKQYGFSGFDDSKYCAFRIVFRQVVVHSFSSPEPTVIVSETPKYDLAVKGVLDAVAPNSFWTLSTVDQNGRPHSRTMSVLFHPVLGLHHVTRRDTPKTKQIGENSHVSLNFFNPTNFYDFNFEATAVVQDSEMWRYAIWEDGMKKFGYPGPSDQSLTPIQLNVTKGKFVRGFTDIDNYDTRAY